MLSFGAKRLFHQDFASGLYLAHCTLQVNIVRVGVIELHARILESPLPGRFVVSFLFFIRLSGLLKTSRLFFSTLIPSFN